MSIICVHNYAHVYISLFWSTYAHLYITACVYAYENNIFAHTHMYIYYIFAYLPTHKANFCDFFYHCVYLHVRALYFAGKKWEKYIYICN